MGMINLVANGTKLMSVDSLVQHYVRCKDNLQKAKLHGCNCVILANYDGYVTVIFPSTKRIGQGWAGEITV